MDTKSGILVFIGPSGCGKSTIVQQLILAHDIFVPTLSYTDRPARKDEPEADHKFVTAGQFDELHAQNYFLEIVQPFDLPYRYGLPAVRLEEHKISVIMLREAFLPLLKKYYPEHIVYQIEADYTFAHEALARRDEVAVGSRLSQFESELEKGRDLARRLYINSFEITPARLAADIYGDVKLDFKDILSL